MKGKRNILTHRLQIVACGRKRLENTKFWGTLLVLVIIAGIFSLSPAISSLMNDVVIRSTGKISTTEVTARSGSPEDIQAALNAVVAAGGGTVYVPEGDWVFNPPKVMWGCGVEIIGGVNVIGAGIGKTILRTTVDLTGVTTYMFGIDGTNGKPSRISGISFIGKVPGEETGDEIDNVGITIDNAKDFRVDHCSFTDYSGMAIFVGNSQGIIDHCSFDNPYKDSWQPHNQSAPYWSVWGYGIVIVGDYGTWDPLPSYLGQYRTLTVYIENCNFSRCRHAISSNSNAFYVSRYNYFERSAAYGQNDVHGNAGNGMGGRGLEAYGNVYNLTDESYSLGQDSAILLRGGGGVAWNNTVILNLSYGTPTVQFSNDGEVYPYDVRQLFIWSNTAMWTNGTLIDFNSRITVVEAVNVTENVNYFLRAPSQTLDGFAYTPYPYPHPLTIETTP
jgi:hypothetical protein